MFIQFDYELKIIRRQLLTNLIVATFTVLIRTDTSALLSQIIRIRACIHKFLKFENGQIVSIAVQDK